MPLNNSSFQKNSNISLIARTIWKHKHISRVDLSRELGLYRSTVTNITSFLIEKGLVVEGEALSSNSKGGRRAITLSLNRDFGCVIGIDMQPSHTRTSILSIDGENIWSGSVEVEEELDFLSIAGLTIEKALEERAKLGIPLLGISLSIPGIIDSEHGVIKYSWPFHCRDVDVRTPLEERFGFPILIENDANAAGWYAVNSGILKEDDNALAIVGDYHNESEEVGVGVGFATIINGNVYQGSHNAAGEFVSLSWMPGSDNQSGLDKDILKTPKVNEASWEAWMDDTFRSIVPLLAIMDFRKVILYGEPFMDREKVETFFRDKLPQLTTVLGKTDCRLEIESQIGNVSALGAGFMCLQNLFTVPSLEESGEDFSSHWDDIIAFSSRQR